MGAGSRPCRQIERRIWMTKGYPNLRYCKLLWKLYGISCHDCFQASIWIRRMLQVLLKWSTESSANDLIISVRKIKWAYQQQLKLSSWLSQWWSFTVSWSMQKSFHSRRDQASKSARSNVGVGNKVNDTIWYSGLRSLKTTSDSPIYWDALTMQGHITGKATPLVILLRQQKDTLHWEKYLSTFASRADIMLLSQTLSYHHGSSTGPNSQGTTPFEFNKSDTRGTWHTQKRLWRLLSSIEGNPCHISRARSLPTHTAGTARDRRSQYTEITPEAHLTISQTLVLLPSVTQEALGTRSSTISHRSQRGTYCHELLFFCLWQSIYRSPFKRHRSLFRLQIYWFIAICPEWLVFGIQFSNKTTQTL